MEKSKLVLVGVLCIALVCITECTGSLFRNHLQIPLLSAWERVRTEPARQLDRYTVLLIEYLRKKPVSPKVGVFKKADTCVTDQKKPQPSASCEKIYTIM